MTFTSEFEVDDKVYILQADYIQEGVIRRIEFPQIDRLSDKMYNNGCIRYGILLKEDYEFYKGGTFSEGNEKYLYRYERNVGRTPEQLFEKILKGYLRK